MSRTGVSVRVLVDGLQLDDGCLPWNAPPYPGRMPEGLSADEGLSITWGRNDTIDQPQAATCSLHVVDSTDTAYYQSFRIGSDVQVLADATVSGGGSLPAFTDPDFESELRAVTTNATATRDNRHVETGAVAAVFSPVNAAGVYSIQLPPGPLQPTNQNPTAWDYLPHLSGGQTWTLGVRVWAPPQVTVVASALVYTGPWQSAVAVGQEIGRTTGTTGGGWVTLQADVAPGVAAGWLGVQLSASGGQAWAQTADSTLWADLPDTLQWRDLSDVWVDRVTVLAPEGGTVMTAQVFAGRITDMEASYDGDQPALDITATDFLGDLGNRMVGAEPWLMEPLADRLVRVLELAKLPGEDAIRADVATTLGPVPMSWDDVDHRAASGLLVDMANSVDGVLWSARHAVTGNFVKLEDPAQRPAIYQLQLVGGFIIIQQVDTSTLPPEERPLAVSACDVLRDPVRWLVDVSDIATRVTVRWQDQTTTPPTERTTQVIDRQRESEFGTRGVSLQTLLTTSTAAQAVADRIRARSGGDWRLAGLVVADADFQVPDAVAVNILLTLLDSLARCGMAIEITEMPAWAPLGSSALAYVEGGTYSYTAGGWELALNVSRASGLGQNAQWDQLPPTWTWDQVDPSITWAQLRGVAAPPP